MAVDVSKTESSTGELAPGAYDAAAVEGKWQGLWKSSDSFAAPDPGESPASILPPLVPTSAELRLDLLRGILVADVIARFARAQGRDVLFALGFDDFASEASPDPEQREQLRTILDQLGCSCDWGRAFSTSEPDCQAWNQRLFLAMLDSGLLRHRQGHSASSWHLQLVPDMEKEEDPPAAMAAWSEAALSSQRKLAHAVEGFEIEANILGIGQLPVFIADVDAIELAGFVAVSPQHPEVETFAQSSEMRAQLEKLRAEDASDIGPESAGLIETGLTASVVGAPQLLPVIVTGLVDLRFGPTAVLGIPERDDFDRVLKGRLRLAQPSSSIRLSASNAKPRRARRAQPREIPVSRRAQRGTPLPIARCERCGPVPVLQDRPAVCPQCGDGVQAEFVTFAPEFERTWIWLAGCVPADARAKEMLNHPQLQQWLPASTVVEVAGAGSLLFDQRAMTSLLRKEAAASVPPAGEPFARALLCGSIFAEGGDEPMSAALPLDREVSGDCLRLALLVAAAPGTSFRWTAQSLMASDRFLDELWAFAEPRLRNWAPPSGGEIDPATRLRRRLVTWLRVAIDKTTTHLEELRTRQAIDNIILLLTRIQDFEQRAAAESAEPTEADRAAIAQALEVLVQMLAPFAPHICEELWERSGGELPLAESRWPSRIHRPHPSHPHASVAQLATARTDRNV